MKTKKLQRRRVESVRNRLVESYARGLVRRFYPVERDFFDSSVTHRSIGVRFRHGD